MEGERWNNIRIILDKMILEVGKPHEYIDIFKVVVSLSILNSGNLFWIHFDSLYIDDKTQVLEFLLGKFVLF
jgi:heptaprenylglyceryl phosphate synthase